MKTIEEKADEYIHSVVNGSMGSAVNAAYDAFIAGYNEAMRWRDPVNDPPKCNDLMQIKYGDIFSNIINYGHDRYLEDMGMWDIEQLANIKVLAWRPIK